MDRVALRGFPGNPDRRDKSSPSGLDSKNAVTFSMKDKQKMLTFARMFKLEQKFKLDQDYRIQTFIDNFAVLGCEELFDGEDVKAEMVFVKVYGRKRLMRSDRVALRLARIPGKSGPRGLAESVRIG